ncbi:MAG: hypothetical protein B6D77_06745 [gamma proteobacterium symbiont of Ctena orbiculata]|nr:MAG: hypothetical protein B6D77_06745 [gamma proteobacterium symbiont of Ctena orbiculata]PVV21156.1 MAG: hypothetical protein B6D79_14075 [gamma proteobacterium symbiont of Ctena orbiculata]PVV21621.1 MAG: hypothetical protein B6D78_07360 [gamma proteobacterium symbiont of Ctena orbiculata]
MKRSLLGAAVAAMTVVPTAAIAADSAEMTEVRRLIEQMKNEYEQKIDALEQRLEAAEQKAETTADKAKQPSTASQAALSRSGQGAVTSASAFNPQISVILDGNYYHDDVDGEGTELLGEADGISHAHGAEHDHEEHGHSHGGAEQGFNFRSAELAFSASVDSYFDATALLAIESGGDVELEEAWLQTRSLPNGFKVKVGKFLSDIGYMNNQHPHYWDFTDQNLAYLNLLGDHGLGDTGVQVTWLPDWDHYTLFGVEVFQGEQEKLGALAEIDEHLEEELDEAGFSVDDLALDDEEDGPRLYTAFLKYAPDLGYDHALQLGVWGGWADQHQEIHGDAEDGDVHSLQGDAMMWGIDAVYKYSAGGAYGHGDIKLQGEYLSSRKDLNVEFHQANPAAIGAERKFTEDGLYIQGLYGFAPRWQVGLRYDVVGLTNKLESSGSELRDWDDSNRWTAALTWTPTEFSQMRLQYAKADITIDDESEDFGYIYLQYLVSMGSHGAHKF